MLHRLPKNPTQAHMAEAYAAGLLRKDELKHGAYYRGRCRNATVARWHEPSQCFIHWRSKWSSRFLEAIRHPVDEQYFDVFMAEAECEPGETDAMPDDQFNEAAQAAAARSVVLKEAGYGAIK